MGEPKKKMDMNAIAKQGYMQKEGKMIKSWRKRWFVLQNNGVMSYYHNELESQPIARVNCKNLTKLLHKSWSKSNKKRYGINDNKLKKISKLIIICTIHHFVCLFSFIFISS